MKKIVLAGGEYQKENEALREKLKGIEALLKSHPDVSRGNSKVHLAYHIAKS